MNEASRHEPVIGLEIHVQLNTKSKMFCASPNNPDAVEPNVNICEVCTGQPGSMPVINKEAIRKGIMVGLALGCEIPEFSKFDRKNYFYPDLPKGYQISQYDQPVAKAGKVVVESGGQSRVIRITRAHLEEDAGKLLHESTGTLVDFNRAGVPLIEIVTEPDFQSTEEAKIFLQNLRNTIRYLGVSDADMEKGHLRCDANISLRKQGETELPNYKVEIKNLNSFKAVEAGLKYEMLRQQEALEAGEQLTNETRGWDDLGQVTVSQRTKEDAKDYRYFPEPDLPILHFDRKFVAEIQASLPELPTAKMSRFQTEYGLSDKDAEVLINDKNLSGFFESVISELQEWLSVEGTSDAPLSKMAKLSSNWIVGDFQSLLKSANQIPQDSRVSAENLAELVKMIELGEVSSTAGKKILQIMFERGGDPSNIAEDEGLGQVSDESAITGVIQSIIQKNPQAVADFKSGKQQTVGFLVGQVMAEMKGKGNPQVVNRLLLEHLENL